MNNTFQSLIGRYMITCLFTTHTHHRIWKQSIISIHQKLNSIPVFFHPGSDVYKRQIHYRHEMVDPQSDSCILRNCVSIHYRHETVDSTCRRQWPLSHVSIHYRHETVDLTLISKHAWFTCFNPLPSWDGRRYVTNVSAVFFVVSIHYRHETVDPPALFFPPAADVSIHYRHETVDGCNSGKCSRHNVSIHYRHETVDRIASGTKTIAKAFQSTTVMRR